MVTWTLVGVLGQQCGAEISQSPFVASFFGDLVGAKRFASLLRRWQILWQHTTLIRWTPHPVIMTIRDNRDDVGVLLYSYCTLLQGWGVLLRRRAQVGHLATRQTTNAACTCEALQFIYSNVRGLKHKTFFKQSTWSLLRLSVSF